MNSYWYSAFYYSGVLRVRILVCSLTVGYMFFNNRWKLLYKICSTITNLYCCSLLFLLDNIQTKIDILRLFLDFCAWSLNLYGDGRWIQFLSWFRSIKSWALVQYDTSSWCERPVSQTSCFDSTLLYNQFLLMFVVVNPKNSNQITLYIFRIVNKSCHVTINRILSRCMHMRVVWWDWI
jgi:hypothetical protein